MGKPLLADGGHTMGAKGCGEKAWGNGNLEAGQRQQPKTWELVINGRAGTVGGQKLSHFHGKYY